MRRFDADNIDAALDEAHALARRCGTAFAASHLARINAKRLLIVGAGALAGYLARAYERARLWWALRLATELAADGASVTAPEDLAAAIARADVRFPARRFRMRH